MRDAVTMRTTLDLDEDVLQAAKELAEVRGLTAGKVVSDLVRKALTPTTPVPRSAMACLCCRDGQPGRRFRR